MAMVLSGEVAESRGVELIVERRDGRRLTVLANVFPLRDESGRVAGAVNCFRDITERKRLQCKAQAQADDLLDLHQRKDEFLAMLSHELRGPLAPILSSVQMLQRGVASPEVQSRLHAIIENQARQLKHLVDDLMDVSRITHGKVQLQLCNTSLGEIVGRAIDTAMPFIEERGHTLVAPNPLPQLTVSADPGRMEQVVVNLLVNAAKYTADGGTISLSATAEAGDAVIRVKDSGIGVSATLLPKIFDLFTQAESSSDRTGGGLGIGLNLVRRLVELHGGVVSATSVLGQGSEFTVRMPLVPTALAEAEPAAAEPVDAHRILVVDDNVDITDCLTMLLEDVGHEVRVAYDGDAAVEAALAFRPRVVLLDIGLPKRNGYDVARAIRLGDRASQPLLIAISGYGREEDLRKSAEAGFDHHLVKPVDFDALLKLLSARLRPDEEALGG